MLPLAFHPRRATAMTALLVLLLPTGASAGAMDRACDPEDAERLTFLESRLRENEPYARNWWRTWMAVYLGGLAFEGTRAGLVDERAKRAAAIANAAKSSIGLARGLLSRPTAMQGIEELGEPPHDAEACRERVAHAEARLRDAAEEVGEERLSWIPHLANFALNAAAAVTVAELYDYDEAYWRGALGFAVGEIRIASFPWHAESDWEAYQEEFGDHPKSGSDTTWSLEAAPNGARLVVRF